MRRPFGGFKLATEDFIGDWKISVRLFLSVGEGRGEILVRTFKGFYAE